MKETIKFISSKEDLNQKESEIDLFFNIYDEISEFREDRKEILGRIRDSSKPKTNLGIFYSGNLIVGGTIFEEYENELFLMTYLFVKESKREKQIELESKIIKGLLNKMLRDNKNKLLLFEVPFKKSNDGFIEYFPIYDLFKNQFMPVYLDFNYLEPISKENNHRLCALPVSDSIKESLANQKFNCFLKELYKPYESQLKDIPQTLIAGKIPYKQLHKFIYPRLKFKKASIALHFAQDIKNINELKEVLKSLTEKEEGHEKEIFCNTFNSFENDLFSMKYADTPPYFTKNLGIKELTLEFKNHFEFNSEGRDEHFIIIDKNKKVLEKSDVKKEVKIYINFTYFKEAEILVWEIIIHPKNYFNEYELIQLTKLYTGKQENHRPVINVKDPQNNNKNIEEVIKYEIINETIKKIINKNDSQEIYVKNESLPLLEAGTSHIDALFIDYDTLKDEDIVSIKSYRNKLQKNDDKIWYWSDIYQYFNADNKKDDLGFDKLDTLYSNKNFENIRYILNTFCGISLGIFDFDRMSFEEVADTLSPLTTTDSYFVQLNKNAINCFCYDNKIFSTSLEQGIGINPYLIIPNSVLAFNSFLTTQVEKEIEKKTKYIEKIKMRLSKK